MSLFRLVLNKQTLIQQNKNASVNLQTLYWQHKRSTCIRHQTNYWTVKIFSDLARLS